MFGPIKACVSLLCVQLARYVSTYIQDSGRRRVMSKPLVFHEYLSPIVHPPIC